VAGVNREILARRVWKLEVSEYIVLIMVLAYSVVFSYYSIMKHYSFRTYAWDLGILVQSISSATKGKLFTNNVELYYSPTGSFFGIHFAPILFIVVPFFYLIQKVETLLVIQSIILALGAIPIYLIAKHCLQHRLSALLVSAAYLLNPSLQGINWYEFHTLAFFPLFILSATYFLKKRKFLVYVLFIILALMTMEQTTYFIALYVIYSAWEVKKELKELFSSRRPKLGPFIPFITFLIVLIWILISSNIIHILNPNPTQELKAIGNYKILEVNDPAEIPLKAITDLQLTLKAIQFDLPRKIFYIIVTLTPSCFLAFLSPLALLPSFLWFTLSILSNWPPYYQLGFQYSTFTLPFVSIATIETIQNLPGSINEKSLKKVFTRISILSLIIGLILSIFASPLSFIQKPGDFRYFRDYGISTPSSLDNKVMEILEVLPKDALIITTPTIFPHISTHTNAYVIPPENSPSPRLFKSNLRFLQSLKYDYIFFNYFWDKRESDLIYYNFIKGGTKYSLFVMGPGLELYKREYNGPSTKLAIRFSSKELISGNSVVVHDPSSESGKVIMLKESPIADRDAWYGPYITLTPGNYTANFRIKVDNLPEGKVIKLDVWSNSLGMRIASYEVNSRNFTKPFVWHTFSIHFNINERIADMEFRGLEVASNVTICLDYIDVVPES